MLLVPCPPSHPHVREKLEPYIVRPPPGKIRGVKVSADGSLLCEMKPSAFGDLASMKWWQLQRLLMESLPPNDKILILNHQLVNVIHEQDTGLVTAELIVDRQRDNDFKNWQDEYNNKKDELSEFEIPIEEAHAKYFQPCDDQLSTSQKKDKHPKRVRCKAKVLVGADGINSVARNCIYRDSGPGWEKFAPPNFTSFVSIRAMGTTQLPAADVAELREKYLKNGMLSQITCLERDVSPFSLRTMFFSNSSPDASHHTDPFWLAGFTVAIDEDTAEIALARAKEAQYCDSLLRLSSRLWEETNDEDMRMTPFYVVPATHPPTYEVMSALKQVEYPEGFRRPWYYKRAVLAGDAVHGGPNFLAQGGTMGIEDAFELAVGLEAAGLWSDDNESGPSEEVLGRVFEDYRLSRLTRVNFHQKYVMNRVSEYELDTVMNINDVLWGYDPSEVVAKVRKRNYI